MQSEFVHISSDEFNENAFRLIGKDWMLLCAGTIESYNMMTASWGGMGIIWNKPVVFTFVRHQRFTFEFIENNSFFTLSFLDASHRSVLNEMGTLSGRNINKMKTKGLTPAVLENSSIAFSEARYILECRKLYFNDLIPENFLDPAIIKNYPLKDYHRMYFGEVLTIMKRK